MVRGCLLGSVCLSDPRFIQFAMGSCYAVNSAHQTVTEAGS